MRRGGGGGDRGKTRGWRPWFCSLALSSAWVLLPALSGEPVALTRHKQVHHGKKADAGKRHAALKKGRHAAHDAAARRKSAPSTEASSAPAATPAPLSGDLAAVRQAIDLVRKSKTGEATAIEKTIGDPAAQKLVEWFILRHPDGEANFSRYAAFIADNPSWPSMGLFRRRAEVRLGQGQTDAATVRRFTAWRPACS